MMCLALSIQNAIYQDQSTQLLRSSQSLYIQYINDIAYIRDIMFRFEINDDRIIYHIDCIMNKLKHYMTCIHKLRENTKIGQVCIWMATNICHKYSIDDLGKQIRDLDETIKGELRICHKKIYRSIGLRARSYTY